MRSTLMVAMLFGFGMGRVTESQTQVPQITATSPELEQGDREAESFLRLRKPASTSSAADVKRVLAVAKDRVSARLKK